MGFFRSRPRRASSVAPSPHTTISQLQNSGLEPRPNAARSTLPPFQGFPATRPAPLSVMTNVPRNSRFLAKDSTLSNCREENKPMKQYTISTKPFRPRLGDLSSNSLAYPTREITSHPTPPYHAAPTTRSANSSSIRSPKDSPDWAARIRSVFYNKKEPLEDETDDLRGLFHRRDSAGSDEDDTNEVFIHNLDLDLDAPPALRASLTFSDPSDLPYLRHSQSYNTTTTSNRLTMSSSASSGAFNDLLASVERKYPGRRWRDIVQFEFDGVAPVVVPDSAKERAHWSEVLCIDEYADS
ncbi:hypothetical protein R3P38DRAFT_827332 [Favolaschia claudopus]|uniref:Uncharacterized protein n=1 Tax=Favolaschia claudopus TaxID=2862362 RepID=A0AAW0C2B5_9AGAR